VFEDSAGELAPGEELSCAGLELSDSAELTEGMERDELELQVSNTFSEDLLLTSVTLLLDDKKVVECKGQNGVGRGERLVFRHLVKSGDHDLEARLRVRGAKDASGKNVQTPESKHAFTVASATTLRVKLAIFENGGSDMVLEDRPNMRWDRMMLRAR
jgi:hypothetical protein